MKNLALLGISTPFMASLLSSCSKYDFHKDLEVNFNGKVLVIGAGSAGLIAGHILKKYNIDFQIIEASPVFGGRVKKIEGFADFPIDLGGEWIHTDPSVLARLLNDPESEGKIDIVRYSPEEVYIWKNNQLRRRNFFSNFYGEYKFKSSTWYDFFDQHIVPGIQSNIIFNAPVKEIDYSSDRVVVKTENNDTYEADKVLVTVPLKILQNNFISFQPALPQDKTNALNEVRMPDGIKVFMEFSEKFYPDIVLDGGIGEIMDEASGDKAFYDIAFRKDTSHNVLALFAVGDAASVYTNMAREEDIVNRALSELDMMFNGKASETFIKHVIQNWSKEPFIKGSYSHYDNETSYKDVIQTLKEPVDNKVFFAGEAYYADDYATVHGAGESAYAAMERILKD